MQIDYSLYLVTDRGLMRTQTLTEAVEQAILGGCTMVQLREKESSSLDFYEQAQEVKRITDRYEVPLIINDRVDIALAVKAAGVHNALEYLKMLKESGIKLAVATGLPEKLFVPCLENNSVLGLFDALCSTDEVIRGKEFPDVFELAARRLKVAPERCLVFDDVLPAVRSAKQAGMLVCGVYDKYSAHHQTEIERISDRYIKDFTEAPLPGWEI